MRIHTFLAALRYFNWVTIKKTFLYAWRRSLTGLSAQMAFHSMLALFPAILTLLTAIGLLENSLESSLPNLAVELELVIPDDVWQLIYEFVDEIQLAGGNSWLSLSFLLAVLISSSALSAAMKAIDQIYRIPKRHQRSFWQGKLISLVLTLGTMLLLIIASCLTFVGNWLVTLVASATGISMLASLWRLIIPPITLGLVATAFGLVYRLGASHWKHGRPVTFGAIIAAISWAGVSSLFRLYVANFAYYNKIYGAVGAVIVLMLWLYLSCLVMLLGAQLNATIGEAMLASREREKGRRKKEEGWN